MSEQLCRWVKDDGSNHWQLFVTVNGRQRSVATVFSNGTWHTWNRNGTGGENSSEPTVKQAKVEAAASAIEQGFI